jgi:hypothetical protein
VYFCGSNALGIISFIYLPLVQYRDTIITPTTEKPSQMNSGTITRLASSLMILTLLFWVFGCGSEKKKEASSSQEFEEAAQDMASKIERAVYNIPPPSEIPYIIQGTGADFNPGIINDAGKYEGYLVSPKKAAFNLGVYATDIGYLSSYSKTQEALNYMDVCLKLTDAVGVQEAIDLKVLERFEKNLSNADSLGNIINEVIRNSEKYLRQAERNDVSALIVGGSFIEALYIATQIIETYPKDMLADDQRLNILAPLVRLLADQRDPLNDLVDLLNSVGDKDEWIVATINSLEELKANYMEFNPEEKIADGKGQEVLNDETLSRLTRQVDSIRSNIVY